jgi:7TMR-DISM extracellular 2
MPVAAAHAERGAGTRAQPLLLDPALGAIDAWPAVTMLADPGRDLTVNQVLARRGEFARPAGAHANLGVRRDVVRLHLPLRVPAGAQAHWIVSVDYASIDRIERARAPLPMLLAVPVAYRRARRGERIGIYMLLGWGVYGVSTLTMAGLLRGLVPSNF